MAQRSGSDLPAAVERTQQGVRRNADVVQEHLREIGRTVEGQQGTGLDAGQARKLLRVACPIQVPGKYDVTGDD